MAIHAELEIKAWQNGVVKFLEELSQNPELAQMANEKGQRFFSDLPKCVMSEFVEAVQTPNIG